MIEGETIKWRTDGIRYSLIENNDEYENTKFEAKLIGKMADFIKRNMN